MSGIKIEFRFSELLTHSDGFSHCLNFLTAPCVVPHVTQGKVILVPSNITQDTNETTPSSAPTTQIIGSSTVVHHG